MRGVAVVLLSLAMISGARASSIFIAGEAGSSTSPSVIGAEQAKPPIARPTEPLAVATPSIIALGEAVPAVSDEKVAAIPGPAKHGRAHLPMVIRAGVVGGGSAAPAANAPSIPASGVAGATAKAPNGTLRDAMTQAGRAPAVPQ